MQDRGRMEEITNLNEGYSQSSGYVRLESIVYRMGLVHEVKEQSSHQYNKKRILYLFIVMPGQITTTNT